MGEVPAKMELGFVFGKGLNHGVCFARWNKHQAGGGVCDITKGYLNTLEKCTGWISLAFTS